MAKTSTIRKRRAGNPERGRKHEVLENMLVRLAIERKHVDIERILRTGPLEIRDWAAVMHLKPRTLTDRLREERAFGPLEQDRVRLVEQVMERGSEVFSNKDKFKQWLDSPRASLGGHRPKELLVSIEGIGAVMAELGRIEHGVF